MAICESDTTTHVYICRLVHKHFKSCHNKWNTKLRREVWAQGRTPDVDVKVAHGPVVILIPRIVHRRVVACSQTLG